MSSSTAISKLPIEAALDRMMDGFVLMDREFRILYMNPAAERISQTGFSGAMGRAHWDVWPASVGTTLESRYRAALEMGEAQHFEHHYLGDGLDVWLEIHAYPSEVGLTVYYRDISERRREQAEAARVERAYKAALSNTPDLVYVFDLDHRFTYANEALLTMWGRSWEDAIGKSCLELGYPEWHAAMHDREIETVVATRQAVRGLVPFTGTHGRRYYDYIFVPVMGVNGEVEAVAGTTRDVTERHEAEEAVRHERRLLAEIFRQAPAFVAWMSGPDHVFQMINPPYGELIGQRDVIGKPVREVIPEVREQGFIALLDRVYRTGEPYRAINQPLDLERSPGQPLERRYVSFVYQPMREADGSVSGVIALGVDATETMKAEEALRQNEKLAATGRMAASIAHEINNPLESVTNLLYLLQHERSLAEEARTWVSTAQSELARVSQITTQTLKFYRQATKPARANIHEILNSSAALYERRLRSEEISLERRYSGPAEALIFEGELRQVATNLLGNAVDAMSPGGRILLRQRRATDWISGRRGIRVTVADTGHGVPRELRARIFDPFFTTKGALGTGLGLWITREIVEKHQGRLRVRSAVQPGRSGSVFALFLPDLAKQSEFSSDN